VRQCPHCWASANEPADLHTLETEIRPLLILVETMVISGRLIAKSEMNIGF
jgi:hypothetical protein